jgi:hypothetical protein
MLAHWEISAGRNCGVSTFIGNKKESETRRLSPDENEGREIRTPNLLIWSQTSCSWAIPP